MITNDQLLDIKHFKSELNDYYFLTSKIQRLKDEKLEIETRRGIRSVRYDRDVVQGSQDPLVSEYKRFDDIDRLATIEESILRYQIKLNDIISFCKRAEYGESIMLIYCLGKSTYKEQATKLYMDEKTLKRRINKEILEHLEYLEFIKKGA